MPLARFISPESPSQHKNPETDSTQSQAPGVFLVLTLAACGMACLMALLPAAGHDQMWLLYAARLVLHGAPLYGPQIFESNPPLIMWLSLLPVAVANLLHLSETATAKLFFVALECGIAAICLSLLRRLRSSFTSNGISGTVFFALAFVYVSVFAVMPARDFGQRDHVLVLFCLPYIFAATLDAQYQSLPRWQSILIGILALLGLTMKPHQLLIPIVVEATVLFLRSRNRPASSISKPSASLLRSTLIALIASGFVFLLLVRIFAANYFTQVVPWVRDTYWAFGQLTIPQLFLESIQLHILAAITLAILFATGWRKASTLTILLTAAGAASLLAFYLQGTGWYYQQLPSLSFFALALAFLLIESAGRSQLTMPRWAFPAATGLSLLALALTAHFSGYPFTAERSFPIDTPDPSFFSGLAPGAPVMTFSTTVDYILPPIYKYNLTLGQRFPLLIMLPGILRSEDPQGGRLKRHIAPERIAELDQFQHAAMTEDMNRWRPVLILVERCQDLAVECQVLEDRHDNVLAWFLRDADFRAAFSRYHFLRSSGRFDAYVPN